MDTTHRDGLSSRCKPCTLLKREQYRKGNRERLKLKAREDRRREPERGCWHVMIARCHNPESQSFPYYGARGITVCRRWRDSFEDFLSDMGPRPSPEHSLDRFPDQNGNYEPGNVRWATREQQARNMRSNTILAAFGRTQCIAAWSDETGIPQISIIDRVGKLGWSVEEALSTPRFTTGQRRKRSAA